MGNPALPEIGAEKMLKREIKIGDRYEAKVSGSRVQVRITGESVYGGWEAVNEKTGRRIRIRTAARLSPLRPVVGYRRALGL
jgi:hypothetical protein